MLSGPPDTATPKRALAAFSASAPMACFNCVSRSPSAMRPSGRALGPGPALVHHPAQAVRQAGAIDLPPFRIDLARIGGLLELDQRLAKLGQAVGCAVTLGPRLVIFVTSDGGQRPGEGTEGKAGDSRG